VEIPPLRASAHFYVAHPLRGVEMRIQAQRGFEFRHSLADAAEPRQHGTEIAVERRVVLAEAHRLPKVGDCLLPPACRNRIVSPHPQHLAQMLARSFVLRAFLQDFAELGRRPPPTAAVP
jgi:hypothetical protein